MTNNKKKSKKNIKWDIIFYISIIAWPIFQFSVMWVGVNVNSILLAFKQYTLSADDYKFVGFLNFQNVLHDWFSEGLLLISLKNSFAVYALSLLSMPISIILSFYIFKKAFGSKFFKIVLYVPSFISDVVLVLIFKYLADRGYPYIAQKLTGIQPLGLLSGNNAYLFVLLRNLFFSFAANIMLYLGAMNSIDSGLFEAAQLDGAKLIHEFIHIVLPGIWPTISTFLIVGAAGILTADPGLYLIWAGAAPREYYTFGYYMFKGVKEASPIIGYPYYSAFGLLLTCISIPLVFGMKWLMNRFDPMKEG